MADNKNHFLTMKQELKPAICVLNPDDVYNLKKNYPEDSYYCVTPYEVLELQKQGVTIPASPHLQEGLVLTREPNSYGYYYRTDDTDSRVINERCLAIEAILSYLGGKEFHYSETSSFRSRQKFNVGVEGGLKKSGIDVSNKTDVGGDSSQGQDEGKVVVAQWSGVYTKKGYERAVELARVNGLINDPQIAALLEQRLPTHPNPIASQEYHVNVTADLDKSLHVLEDISANLKDKIGAHLKVDVSTSRKIDQAATVDFFVSFGPIPIELTEKAIKDEERQAPQRKGVKWLWPIVVIFALLFVAGLLFLVLK